ncbi:hypothetical protein [Gallaecimonas xiamenensis]|uniref:hypothetical protein n=1 Tax=Gallaecimonas xiamenensis TaxID=1207039 RepID=UPI0012E9C566|nr:hypothetical protein [Gallaecimonas xiamenensis]
MIALLGPNSFRGVLTAPKANGISPLIRGKINIGGDDVRCYIKPQPDEIMCPSKKAFVDNMEIVNEALGFVLAKSFGFYTPDIAGIIILNREQIPRETVEQVDRVSSKKQDRFICWFSKDMNYPNLSQSRIENVNFKPLENLLIKRLADDLKRHDDTINIIAFDDWLLNSDRHLGNLLDGPANSIFLIDHGRILNYPNWSASEIFSLPPKTVNRLENFIENFHSGWKNQLPNKSKRQMAISRFKLLFEESGKKAAREVLSEFVNDEDVEVVVKYLESRLDPVAYAKASGLLI